MGFWGFFFLSFYKLFSYIVKIENHLYGQIKDIKLNQIIRTYIILSEKEGSDQLWVEKQTKIISILLFFS